jgi:hypothetical protein
MHIAFVCVYVCVLQLDCCLIMPQIFIGSSAVFLTTHGQGSVSPRQLATEERQMYTYG